MKQILRIDASARYKNSFSRTLTDKLVAGLIEYHPGANITTRNIYSDSSFLSEAMVEGKDIHLLAVSDSLIDELLSADILVLAVPVYNFSIPAALKAYIDLVVRAGRTFNYGANGPQGLVKGLSVYVVVTSNGTSLYGDGDFVSGYLNYILNFIGVINVAFIDGTQILLKGIDKVTYQATAEIEKMLSCLL